MKSKKLFCCMSFIVLFAALILSAQSQAAETQSKPDTAPDASSDKGGILGKKNIAPADVVELPAQTQKKIAPDGKKDQVPAKDIASAPNMNFIPDSLFEKYAIDMKTNGVAVSFMRPGMPAATAVLAFTQASEVTNADGTKKVSIKMTSDGRLLDVLVAKDGTATFAASEKKTGAVITKGNFATTGAADATTKPAR